MKKNSRFWELDLIRAVALLLMLVQHVALIWNFVLFDTLVVNPTFQYIGRVGAILFLSLVGVSGYISYCKHKTQNFSQISNYFLRRGLILLAWGLVISFVTFITIPASPILFGVLSCIGFSIIFLPFFIKYKVVSWVVILLSPFLGYILGSYHPTTNLWIALGSYPSNTAILDYWPIFPWIGLVLLGLEIARLLYKNGERLVMVDASKNPLVQLLLWLGSHTLLIYLVHVPVLYGIFYFGKYLLS